MKGDEGLKTFGTMKKKCSFRSVSLNVEKYLYKNVVVLTRAYGAANWKLR